MQEVILLCSLPPKVSDLARVWTRDDVASHRPILAALRKRDPDAVKAAMEAQFLPSFHRDRDRFKSFWSMPFRDSQIGQTLLHEFLSARPASERDGGA
jgi:hypothetical protein